MLRRWSGLWILFSVSLSLFYAETALADLYLLHGQITEGLSLFPPAESSPATPYLEYGAPSGGFPVPYIGKLALGTNKTWTFEFTTSDTDQSERYEVGGPNSVVFRRDLMINEVFFDSSQVLIQFRDTPLHFESFSLGLDLTNGSGSWQWDRQCPVCDLIYPLPSAIAIVTGISIVPEPSGIVIFLIALMASGTEWRKMRL